MDKIFTNHEKIYFPSVTLCSMPFALCYSLVIGWLAWKQLSKIPENARGQFRNQAERKFVEDLVIYLNYKIREAERIRNERKQLSFW
jgi:hypothetical protein